MIGFAGVIAALEAAPEGSRDLDKAVSANVGREWREDALPMFTRSLDNAMNFVPEGWLREISERDPNKVTKPRWMVKLYNFGHSGAEDVEVWHDDLILALCIAALRAVEAEQSWSRGQDE